jgi:hypothetical protein
VFWGQDVRGYAPMVALVTASFVAFVRLVDTDPEAPLNRRALVGYFLSITLAAYFSFVAVLVIPAQLLSLMWRRPALRRVGYTVAVSVIFWIPLMVLAKRRGSGQLFWVPHPSLTVFKQVFEALTSAGLQPSFGGSPTTYVLMGITLALLIGVAVWHVHSARRPAEANSRTRLWGQALVLLWLAVPPALALAESVVAAPIFTPRNLLTCVPAASLALAFAFADRRIPRQVAFGALAALIVLRVAVLVPSYGASPEDWRYTAKTVLADAQPGDCIAFYPLDGRMAFSYYVRERNAEAIAPRPVFPSAPWAEVKPYVEKYATLSRARLRRIEARCPRLWFVSSHEGQRTGPVGSRQNFHRYRRLRARLRHAYAHHHKMRFGYAATIHVLLLSGPRAAIRASTGAALSRRTSTSSGPPGTGR